VLVDTRGVRMRLSICLALVSSNYLPRGILARSTYWKVAVLQRGGETNRFRWMIEIGRSTKTLLHLNKKKQKREVKKTGPGRGSIRARCGIPLTNWISGLQRAGDGRERENGRRDPHHTRFRAPLISVLGKEENYLHVKVVEKTSIKNGRLSSCTLTRRQKPVQETKGRAGAERSQQNVKPRVVRPLPARSARHDGRKEGKKERKGRPHGEGRRR